MANVLLNTREEKNYMGEVEEVREILSIEPVHYDGVYRIRVNKEEHKGCFKSFTLFANGNFNIRLANGRKSQKKLDKIAGVIERHKNMLADMWKEGKYQEMTNAITDDIRVERIF